MEPFQAFNIRKLPSIWSFTSYLSGKFISARLRVFRSLRSVLLWTSQNVINALCKLHNLFVEGRQKKCKLYRYPLNQSTCVHAFLWVMLVIRKKGSPCPREGTTHRNLQKRSYIGRVFQSELYTKNGITFIISVLLHLPYRHVKVANGPYGKRANAP